MFNLFYLFIIIFFCKCLVRSLCNKHQIKLGFLVQVVLVAFKNRKLPLPESHEELYEVYESATLERIAHTNQMR